MKAIDLIPEMHEPPAGAGPGKRLAAAREARGLVVGDVVQELRLPAATLQALESDCHEKLPAPVFVHGYLRAYARLLDLDGETLISEYDRLVALPGPAITPDTSAHHRATARDLYIRGAAALIVVAMVAIPGYWWYGRQNQDDFAPSRTASPEVAQPALPVAGLAPARTDASTPDHAPSVAFAPDTPPQSPASEAAGDSVAAMAPEPPPDDTAAEAGPALPPVNDSLATANTDAEAQHRTPEATPEPAVPDLPIAPIATERSGLVPASRAPTGEQVIVIRATDESWAEVVDANGYQLLYYLLRPDVEQRLQGQPPFQVFLGNALAVELSLNQERFDHTPFHRRNNTARFSVDERL